MNEYMSPEFEGRLHHLLAAPDADAAFVDSLRSKLIERSNVKPIRRFSPRLAWGMALLLGLLILGLLAFSPQVVEAMRRLLGYIPGVGFVEQGPTLRVLSAPVTLHKEGLAVTIEKGAADSQRTVLLVQIEGYPRERFGQNRPAACMDAARLVSADGSVQAAVSSGLETYGEQNDGVLFVRYEFQAMPARPLDATLEIPCLLSDMNYKDWSIPLHFQVAQGTNQVAAVIELPTSLPTRPIPTSVSTPATESAPAGFSIVLKSVAKLKDGYVLSGSYQWSDTRIDKSAVVISDSSITDAKGQAVPYTEVDTDPSADSNPQEIPFAHQITGEDFAWPLNIIVQTISVIQPGQATFQFDAGPNPVAGQIWNVNIDVPLGRHIIHIAQIQVFGGTPPDPADVLGFEFTMTSDPAVASALVRDLNPIIECKSNCGGGGGQDFGVSGFDSAFGPFVDGWSAKGYSPAGLKTFVISDVSVFFQGPWQVKWQPSPP